MSFLAILVVLNFDFSRFEQLSSPNFTKIQSSESLELPKITFLVGLNLPKFDFTQNLRAGRMIKFQQSQALTSHFESFWSIVHIKYNYYYEGYKCDTILFRLHMNG